ncbi:MAG: RNA methyltransferase, partial [Myxococcales bacterium]|nr:RNA methyltransferase [Myxococcales bacterium]
GMVAVAAPPREWTVEELLDLPQREGARQVLVAADGVQAPHTLGAILRSAEFFGAAGALWPRDRAVGLTPAAIRSSAGASERLPLARVTNLARALDVCKDAGFWVLGTVVDGGRALGEICAETLPDRLVLVLGSEERGIRRLTRERCDFLATIPRRGAIGSLNVSTAAAVALAAVCA